jgi:hypothetical protein
MLVGGSIPSPPTRRETVIAAWLATTRDHTDTARFEVILAARSEIGCFCPAQGGAYARRYHHVRQRRATVRLTRFGSQLSVLAAVCGFCAAPAGADSTYHSAHISLAPIAGAPLISGFVENIHADGPNVYAHEIYQLVGAAPSTSYQVVLSIWTTNTSCSGSPTLQLPTATLTTNGAGNGLADVFFTPANADGLRGLTVSARWTLWNATTPTYATDCEIIKLD